MIKKSSFMKGGFLIPVIFLIAGFFVPTFSFAYDSNNAHRALTFETGELYNYSAEYQLTSQEIDWLMQGAKKEDTPPRWVNHFYNPLTGEGWKGNRLGENNSELVLWFSKWALSQRNPLSAKNWCKNRSAQSEYANYKGDRTWQKAIEAYLEGDRQTAYTALGHVLHLIQDMAVPEHTRGDTHAGLVGDKGSPYEAWAKDYTAGKERTLKIAENLKKQGIKPKDLPILDNYFDYSADYSSKYFFSEDTIQGNIPKISGIQNKTIRGVEIKELYVRDDNRDYLSALVSLDLAKNEVIKTTDNEEILNNYWQRLSKQAVISGAGIIQLFHKEVERQSKLPPKFTKKTKIQSHKFISPVGELAKIRDSITNFISKAQQFAQNLFPQKAKTQSQEHENIKTQEQENTNQENNKTIKQGTEPTKTEEDPPPTQDTIQTEIVSMSLSGPPPKKQPEPNRPEFDAILLYYVSRVIDGDTITLSNGKDIRLLGINAPEYGTKCYQESKAKLESLILGKTVRIEKDVSETDKYGRFLRYIYLDGTMINAIMLKSGYANLLIMSPDRKYVDAFKDYREEAQFFERGCLYSQEHKNIKTQEQKHTKATIQTASYLGWSSAGGGPFIDSNAPKTTSTPSLQTEDTSASSSPFSEGEGQVGDSSPTSTPDNSTTSTPDGSATSTPEFPETPTSTPDGSATSTPPVDDEIPACAGMTECETGMTEFGIIINEIQISGGPGDTYNEFVELYNTSSSVVSITGWKLIKKVETVLNKDPDKPPAEHYLVSKLPTGSIIPPASFFLITPQVGYIGSSTPDTTFTGKSKSYHIAKNNTVILQNASSTIVDKVGFGLANDYEEQATLNPPDGQSINRTNFIDTDNNLNDFTIATSTPQSSSSTPASDTTSTDDPAPSGDLDPDTESPPEPPQPWLNCATTTYGAHNKIDGQAADYDGGRIDFPEIKSGLTTTLEPNTTYYIDDLNGAYVPAGATLVIPEGVVLKFGKWRWGGWMNFPINLRVQGDLEVNGTASNPVIFTTFRDDQRGAPIELSNTKPAPGDWGAIQIESANGKEIKIHHAEIYYAGGRADAANSYSGAIFVNLSDADIEISNIKVAHSYSGIYSRPFPGAQPNILNSNFEYNQLWGVSAKEHSAIRLIGNTFKCNGLSRLSGQKSDMGGVNIEGVSTNTTIQNNNFLGNQNLGITYYTEGGGTLSAENNYWGDSSGPYHPTQNPTGEGDWVSDNVDFTPFSQTQN